MQVPNLDISFVNATESLAQPPSQALISVFMQVPNLDISLVNATESLAQNICKQHSHHDI